jgi:hypothetical protein
MIRNWLPEFSHFESVEGYDLFVTTEGRFGLIFRFPLFDLDERQVVQQLECLSQLTSLFQERVLFRMKMEVSEERELPFPSMRAATVADRGYRRERCLMSFEGKLSLTSWTRSAFDFVFRQKEKRNYERELSSFVKSLPTSHLKRLGVTPLTCEEIRPLLSLGDAEIVKDVSHLMIGTTRCAVLRLWKQGSFDLDEETLAGIKASLTPPFEISVTLQSISPTYTHYLLKKELGRAHGSQDPLALRNIDEAQSVMEETLMEGGGLTQMEWVLILKRPSEDALGEAVKESKRILSALGEIAEENVGAYPSLRASLWGARPHYTFMERAKASWAYLPVASHGSGSPAENPKDERDQIQSRSARTLVLHREDDSLFYFNPFDKLYGGLNCITNGIKGSGKSVVNNLLSRTLLQDPSVRMYKIDVGGSYRKECHLLNGVQFEINMSEPSGINPFGMILEMPDSQDVIETLTKFISPLMLETGEKLIPKIMEAKVERLLLNYAQSKPVRPSMADFVGYSREDDLPRKELLERWSTGIYQNVLKERDQPVDWENGKYFYFNFGQIKDASSGDYAKGVIGSVIALANMEMLRAGDAWRSDAKRRLILFVDEAPFFIEQHARFFKLTTANFRKYGHGTVLIAQSLQSFEFIGENGKLDRGIITNSPLRFLFEIEGEDSDFREKFDITPSQLLRMKSLYRGAGYRECLFQSPGGVKSLEGRVLKIYTNPKEYWEVTSDDSDNEKLFGLMRSVPGLTLEEAILCLSAKHSF